MGVVHKLKPEVIKFILDNKQANPHLSCRSLIALLLEKFQVEVSKSSINAIFKENNLSMPVGTLWMLCMTMPMQKTWNIFAAGLMKGVSALMTGREFTLKAVSNKPQISLISLFYNVIFKCNYIKRGYPLQTEGSRMHTPRMHKKFIVSQSLVGYAVLFDMVVCLW